MEFLFIASLFVVAFLYSSVGHGGASGYLALMALFSIDVALMRSSALLLNLMVSGTAFISFYRGGFFRWKLLIPFVVTSVPAAYFGARLNVDPQFYKLVLGVCLLLAAGRIFYTGKRQHSFELARINWILALLTGSVIGIISGMIGIGGGVILSPLLIVLGWADLRQSAAVSAAFIWLNSASGLAGIIQNHATLSPDIILWTGVALAGGILGSWLGSKHFSVASLRYFLALVLVLASLKLLLV